MSQYHRRGSVYYGHFSDSAMEEVARAALFRRDGDKWRLKWYRPGLIIKDCVIVPRKDGRDLLLCSDLDGGQGTNWRTVSVVDLALPARFRETVLLTVIDNMITCGSGGATSVQKGVFTEVSFDRTRSLLEAKIEYGRRR